MSKRMIVAITGASGAIYAVSFLEILRGIGCEVHGIISDAGREVLRMEQNRSPEDLPVSRWHDVHDIAAPMASGSSRFDGMVVLPCTMGTLGAIANGICQNLIHRSADVMLKERRPLVLAPRETPLNRIHLQNMLKAHEAGAVIFPPMPSYYHNPGNLDELARRLAGRIADILGLEIPDMPRWDDER